MTSSIAKIEKLTATLPEDARTDIEAHLVAETEALVKEVQAEDEARVQAGLDGLAALERGEAVPADEAFATLRTHAANWRGKQSSA